MDVSLYFSTADLRMVVGNPSYNAFQVEEFFSESLPEGLMINGIITAPEPLTQFLGSCYQQWGPFKQKATLVIESNTIRAKRIELPTLRETQMLPYLRGELVSLMEEGADDLLDYAVLGTDQTTGATKALGVVAGRVQLENYARVVREAGFNLKRIDIGTNALAKLPQLLPQLQTGVCMLGLIDGNVMGLVYYQQGEYMLARRYRLLAPEATEERRIEAIGHLSAMQQFHKSQNRDSEMDAIYVAGISSERVALLDRSAAHVGIPLLPLETPSQVSLRGQAAFNAADFELSSFLYNIGALLKK